MSGKPKRPWLLVALMLAVTAVVASTAIRIEWYNHAVGGFLPRPQPPSIEGNDVKWRATSPEMAEMNYRRAICAERGLDVSDAAVAALTFTESEQQAVDRLRREAMLDARFRSLVSSMGLLQYLLVPIGIICGVLLLPQKGNAIRLLAVGCLVGNSVAGGLMLYREYFPSLGW